ncbi:hypothetical protein PM082_007726 [Marasmius tenuissimus]|nr:hypothetical protein PM082_007726 [Marasmius tenuissimus]
MRPKPVQQKFLRELSFKGYDSHQALVNENLHYVQIRPHSLRLPGTITSANLTPGLERTKGSRISSTTPTGPRLLSGQLLM